MAKREDISLSVSETVDESFKNLMVADEQSPSEQAPSQSQPRSTYQRVSTPLSADIQARILAFQEKRSKLASEDKSTTSREQKKNNNAQDKPLPPIPRNTSIDSDDVPPKNKPNLIRLSDVPAIIPSLTPQIQARIPTKAKPSLSQRRNGKGPGLTLSNMNGSTVGDVLNRKGQAPAGVLPVQSQLKDSFASYSKYIDVKSGQLNFAGKASLHSKGIDFSSGSSFRISLDKLKYIEELGRGNYGTVSKVLHIPTGVTMAMKEVRLELDEAKFSQILMELDILHKCNSPFIVDFYGAFFVEGAVYMCMEYMDGGSLDKIYGDGVDEGNLAYITESVIRGLKQLKDEHNIIHRDVKPTNILVNTSGKVKLCDFGVSGNLVASLARTNIGCQSYMAPERIRSLSPDDVTYSVQSDIWSLGLSILEVAKGSYPYPPETYNNIFSQLSAIVDGEPPTLPEEKFSEEAQLFVRQCLNKIPDLRPTYANLLSHPWLLKFRNSNTHMDEFVQNRLSEIELERLKEREEKEDKKQKEKPPLHMGGLSRDQ